MGLPFGQAFKFSRNWFEKYHKYKGEKINAYVLVLKQKQRQSIAKRKAKTLVEAL